MRIKLITPAFHSRYFWDFRKLASVLGRSSNNLLLALPTVAALTSGKHEVILLDDNVDDIDYDEPVDLVGVTAMTCYVNRAFAIADEYRKRGVPVVMGGPHATLAPFEALEHVDTVVIGEAENVWNDLLTDFEAGEMKEVYRGVDAKPTLKDNPAPRWDLVPSTDYLFFGVEATRGCPFDCSFCSIKQIYGNDFRVRTVDEVVAEIKAAPNNQIFFTDDNLIGNKPFVTELFPKMKDLGVSWGCQMSINVAFMPEMLQAMKDCGCFFVFIGLETLDKEAVVAMNKPVNKMDYYKAIENVQGMGMHVIGSFILGADHDTKDSFQELATFVAESKLSWVMINLMNSPPGTRFLAEMEAQGRNVVYSYDELDGAHATVTHPVMTRDEIEDGFRWLYREIYDWDNLRERLCATLDTGTWTQVAMTLSFFDQARVGAKLLWEYLVKGSAAQRRFFLAVVSRFGRRVNKESIVNILLLAMNWHEFANTLTPSERPTTAPMVFRKEYMVPVAEQTIGVDGAGSGVLRVIPRMTGSSTLASRPGDAGGGPPPAG